MSNARIGQVTHYYHNLKVAVLALTEKLHVGDYVHFQGHTTDFHQKVTSLEINHHQIDEAWPGQEVALKVMGRVRPRDRVSRSTEEEASLSLEDELMDAWQ
jgi:putative protease